MIKNKTKVLSNNMFKKKIINSMISKFSNFEDSLDDNDWLKYVVEYDFFHTRLSLFNCYTECNNNLEKAAKLVNKRRIRFERLHH